MYPKPCSETLAATKTQLCQNWLHNSLWSQYYWSEDAPISFRRQLTRSLSGNAIDDTIRRLWRWKVQPGHKIPDRIVSSKTYCRKNPIIGSERRCQVSTIDESVPVSVPAYNRTCCGVPQSTTMRLLLISNFPSLLTHRIFYYSL